MTPKRTPPSFAKKNPKRKPKTPRKVLVRWVTLYQDAFGLYGGRIWSTEDVAKRKAAANPVCTVRIEIPVEGL